MKNLWRRHSLAVLSFVVPFLITGFGWKFWLFKEEYLSLQTYREDIYVPFAFGSLVVQAIFWTYLTYLYLEKTSFMGLSIRIYALSAPLGLSYAVFTIGAKHVMSSVSGFATLEVPFILITHLSISILISACYTLRGKPSL